MHSDSGETTMVAAAPTNVDWLLMMRKQDCGIFGSGSMNV